MDVKTRLETALAGFAEGVLWPFACPLETEPDLWMVYFPEKEQPVDYGDGNSLTWELFWQVQWFTKGTQDYMEIRKNIRAALEEAGFSVNSISYSFEKGSRTTQMTFFCSILETEEK